MYSAGRVFPLAYVSVLCAVQELLREARRSFDEVIERLPASGKILAKIKVALHMFALDFMWMVLIEFLSVLIILYWKVL